MRAVVLISHGSHSPEARRTIEDLCADLKAGSQTPVFECAFLGIGRPNASDAIGSCVRRGAKRVLVIPNFLNTGSHVTRDIPMVLDEARRAYPNVDFCLTEIIGRHPSMKDLYLDMIMERL